MDLSIARGTLGLGRIVHEAVDGAEVWLFAVNDGDQGRLAFSCEAGVEVKAGTLETLVKLTHIDPRSRAELASPTWDTVPVTPEDFANGAWRDEDHDYDYDQIADHWHIFFDAHHWIAVALNATSTGITDQGLGVGLIKVDASFNLVGYVLIYDSKISPDDEPRIPTNDLFLAEGEGRMVVGVYYRVDNERATLPNHGTGLIHTNTDLDVLWTGLVSASDNPSVPRHSNGASVRNVRERGGVRHRLLAPTSLDPFHPQNIVLIELDRDWNYVDSSTVLVGSDGVNAFAYAMPMEVALPYGWRAMVVRRTDTSLGTTRGDIVRYIYNEFGIVADITVIATVTGSGGTATGGGERPHLLYWVDPDGVGWLITCYDVDGQAWAHVEETAIS